MARPQFGRSVEDASDAASRKDNVSSEFGGANIVDGGIGTVLEFENNTGEIRQLQFASIAPDDGSDAVARADLLIFNTEGIAEHEIIGTVKQYPYILNPTLPIKDGGSFRIDVHNNDGVEMSYVAAAVHRGN